MPGGRRREGAGGAPIQCLRHHRRTLHSALSAASLSVSGLAFVRSPARSHVPSRRSAVTTYHFTTSPLLSRAIWSPFARSLSGGRELLRDRSALLRALVWLLPSHPIPFPPSGVARSIWQSALGPTASWDNLQSRSAGGDTGDGEVKRRPQHRGITHNSGSGVRPGRTTYVVPVSSVCILLSSPRSSSLRLSSSISSSRSVCRDKCMLKCARRARAARNAARSHSRFRFD